MGVMKMSFSREIVFQSSTKENIPVVPSQLQSCQVKTLRGGVYSSKRTAEEVLKRMRRNKAGKSLMVYKCVICNLYHIGNRKPR